MDGYLIKRLLQAKNANANQLIKRWMDEVFSLKRRPKINLQENDFLTPNTQIINLHLKCY